MEQGNSASEGMPMEVECPFAIANSSALKQRVTRAFELLRDPVYRYLFRVMENRSEAEDLTQEVFLRLYIYLHKGQTVTNARAWVFRVAHNLAIDQQRRRIQFEPMDSDGLEQACDPSTGADQRLLDREQHRKLRDALTSLSTQEKHCLELRAEGLSYKEIAGILDIRMPTLVKYLSRIIKKLVRENHL